MDCLHGHHHERHHHQHRELAEGMSAAHVRKLRTVLCLSLLYFISLLIGGYFSHSIALMAEAGHKLGDTSVLALALGAAWFAGLRHSPQKTFSYARMDILAALVNGVLLVCVGIFVG